jgi:cobyrinic acid a,c-diamide synthase
MVADKLAKYLNHKLGKETLVAWCEDAMQEETFEDARVQKAVARIGVADVRNFEISFEELSYMLEQLGYHVKVEVVE